MKYTPKFFWKNIPDWKKKKDPILSRLFYRPLSCVTASIMANIGIAANTVSYFSAFVAIVSCGLFLIDSIVCRIVGAILVNVWLLLDCTDGNLARSYKKQLFGEFADGISSYILVALLCTCMSISVYYTGGVIADAGAIWIVLLGALASTSDTLMRLIYQKFKAVAEVHEKEGRIPAQDDERIDHSKVGSWRVRIESEFGIGGILPVIILLGVIFNALDLVVIYSFVYYCGSCCLASFLQIRKAIKLTTEYSKD